MMRKILILLLILLLLPLVSAELKIEKKVVADIVVPDLNQPAVFDFKITNLGDTEMFEIYSLVGVDMSPSEPFEIKAGEAKTLQVEAMPGKAVLENPGTFNFIYKIKGEKLGIQEDVLVIRIADLKDVLMINSYNINPEAEKAVVYAKNLGGMIFPEIKARFYSSFFDFSETFSLDRYEKKEFEILLNKENIKVLVAGNYIISTDIETLGIKKRIENTFRFTEKADITTKEIKQGFFISRYIIEKTNEGNLPFLVQVEVRKNIISRLFTTFNVEPSKSKRQGFFVNYTFQKEIVPAEIYAVKVTTNWLYPLILLVAFGAIGYLIKIYTSTDIILKKRVGFVKAKGGEFALKITLTAKAKNFVEKAKIIDKIPPLVKVYERFGTVEPDKIDERNKRLEWNVESLQPGEIRLFSYVIYSKVSPVGKFEVPPATAIYEKEGKIHEAESNKVFFLTEPRKKGE